ncbi:MerR family transcriptional regulator [bacterium]|nr:MerR family transcriptional regulator [bacterium]
MRVSDAANVLGVTPSTIRIYDNRSLAVLPRDENGYRVLNNRELRRIADMRGFMLAQRLNLNSLVALSAMIPCWNIMACSKERRAVCRRGSDGEHPCWHYHRDTGGCLDVPCSECTVYLNMVDHIRELRRLYLPAVRC